MRIHKIALALFAASFLFACVTFGQEPPAPHEIQMTAKKYEFSPSVITVKKGERVRLVITATDHDHGFKLSAFHVDQLLKKGQATTVEFTADKAGQFPFKCSHVCGIGHGRMKGMLVVQSEN